MKKKEKKKEKGTVEGCRNPWVWVSLNRQYCLYSGSAHPGCNSTEIRAL